MSKKVFSALNQLVSVLTPVEREFLLRRICLLPDEFTVPAKALLSNQDVFIPSEYLQKRFLRYMLEWIVDELATFGNSLRYKLLGRWKVLSILKWRNSQVERVLKPILHMDKWHDDRLWTETYAPIRIERAIITILLGDIDKKEKTDRVISLLNDIVLVGMDTLLLHDIYHIMTSFKFLTPLAYEESVSIGEEMQRLFSGMRVDVANLHLPEVTAFHIGKWAVIAKRFSIAKQIIRYVEHSLARVEQEDATKPMRVARILYLLGFILPYPELWKGTALRHIRLKDLFHKLIIKLRISSGMKVLNNQTAIVNSAFFSLRDIAFWDEVSMSLSQYILLSKLSRFNPFYHLQFNVALIASLRNKTEVTHAYKRYLSTIEQISRRHKPVRIIYYLWKFILEYEMENFDALIGTANAAYQWDRRSKQYYTNITLWFKRYSIKLHPFANRQTWENALNELEEIYIAEPFLVSIEEFCPLRRWLRQKGGIELPSNDDFLRRVECNARQLFHVPFLDTELTEKIAIIIDNTLKNKG